MSGLARQQLTGFAPRAVDQSLFPEATEGVHTGIDALAAVAHRKNELPSHRICDRPHS
jgi:hypothetical protein